LHPFGEVGEHQSADQSQVLIAVTYLGLKRPDFDLFVFEEYLHHFFHLKVLRVSDVIGDQKADFVAEVKGQDQKRAQSDDFGFR